MYKTYAFYTFNHILQSLHIYTVLNNATDIDSYIAAVTFQSHVLVIFDFLTFSRHENERRTDDRPSDIMWCRDPFMEALNEIDDIN